MLYNIIVVFYIMEKTAIWGTYKYFYAFDRHTIINTVRSIFVFSIYICIREYLNMHLPTIMLD